MNKKHLKEAIIFILLITLTLITNSFYKRQYIKSVSAENHYDYTLSATQLDMKLGSIFSIYAVGNDAPKVKWYSSDPNVAIINSFGQVIAKNVGQTIITAKYKKECKDMIINVNKDASQDVLIYKDSTTIATTGESLNKININTYILTLSKNKYTYTGKHIKPKASITSTDGHKLIKNKDYTVKYHDNKKAGKAQVLVTGIGDYTGSLVGTFVIEKSNEDVAMDPNNNSNDNDDTEVQSESSNKTVTTNRSTDTNTSILTPTSPEKSRISSTRTQSYKNTSNKSNNSKKSNTSTKSNGSTKNQKKSTMSKENTKNSFTKSDSSTTHNSFEKNATNTTDNTNSGSSKNSSNSSDTNSSSTDTDSSNNSTDNSSSGSTTTDSTNSNTTESTSN